MKIALCAYVRARFWGLKESKITQRIKKTIIIIIKYNMLNNIFFTNVFFLIIIIINKWNSTNN